MLPVATTSVEINPERADSTWPPAVIAGCRYSAAKEAIRSLTRTAAREWGCFGITVNCICPASASHRMPVAQDGDDARSRAFAAMYKDHPLGRDGDPEADIAPVVAFLLSDASQYMTGQTFMVDGGGSLRA